MSRKSIPSLRRHKASGQGIVTLSGRDIYCGLWPASQKSPPSEVEAAYQRAVHEWLAAGKAFSKSRPATPAPSGPLESRSQNPPEQKQNVPEQTPTIPRPMNVEELLAEFWTHAQRHYRLHDGTESNELHSFRSVFRPLRQLYGTLPVNEFSPLKLKAVREELVQRGLSRQNINNLIRRVRHAFKWGVENELVPGSVLQGLQAVSGLKRGRSEAPEGRQVTPVPAERVEGTLKHMPKPVADIVRLLMLTGARCGEIVQLKSEDIDRSGPVWIFTPKQHKTAYKGKARRILFGPKAQTILSPLLEGLAPSDFVFSPRRFVKAQLAERSQRRKSKRWQSHIKHQAAKRKAKKKRAPGEWYATASVGHAIARACMVAFPPPAEWKRDRKTESVSTWKERLGASGLKAFAEWRHQNHWHVHQCRHLVATTIRKEFSLEHASSVLGHSGLDITQRYAELGLERAVEVAGKMG